MKVGDWVVYRSKVDRQFYVGHVVEDYDFRPDLSGVYPNVRKVKWEGVVPPTGVFPGARNEHGSALTLYQIKNYGEEFVLAVQGENVLSDEQDEEETATVRSFYGPVFRIHNAEQIDIQEPIAGYPSSEDIWTRCKNFRFGAQVFDAQELGPDTPHVPILGLDPTLSVF